MHNVMVEGTKQEILIEWCENNIENKWDIQKLGDFVVWPYTFRFKNEEDAVQFKLRWG